MSKKRDYLDMTKKSPSKMLKIPRSTGKVRDDDSSFSGHYQDSRVLFFFYKMLNWEIKQFCHCEKEKE